MNEITFRSGTAADAEAIAQLHIASWQYAYRGILSDEFLDDAVKENRLRLWQRRLASLTEAHLFIELAEQASAPVGFICAMLDHDPAWGTLIDNVHVLPEAQGQGLGRRLLQGAATWHFDRGTTAGLYLWVYKANDSARGFYERVGGEAVELMKEVQPDGVAIDIARYAWKDPHDLV